MGSFLGGVPDVRKFVNLVKEHVISMTYSLKVYQNYPARAAPTRGGPTSSDMAGPASISSVNTIIISVSLK